MCPFSILAFLQPTTVDKEPHLKEGAGDKECYPPSLLVFLNFLVLPNRCEQELL